MRRGGLAAAADSLGRVLLLDSVSMTVLRIWRAYRGVQLAWLALPVAGMRPCTDTSVHRVCAHASATFHPSADGQCRESGARSSSSGQHAADGLQLHLVMYAPRKGVLEVWQMEHGPCVCKLAPVTTTGTLLGPSLPAHPDQGQGQQNSAWMLKVLHLLGQCWLVDWGAQLVMDVAFAALQASRQGHGLDSR